MCFDLQRHKKNATHWSNLKGENLQRMLRVNLNGHEAYTELRTLLLLKKRGEVSDTYTCRLIVFQYSNSTNQITSTIHRVTSAYCAQLNAKIFGSCRETFLLIFLPCARRFVGYFARIKLENEVVEYEIHGVPQVYSQGQDVFTWHGIS